MQSAEFDYDKSIKLVGQLDEALKAYESTRDEEPLGVKKKEVEEVFTHKVEDGEQIDVTELPY